MSNPQQPELARSRKTPSQDPDSVAAVLEGSGRLAEDHPRGPVPPENQPGHHPPVEQDKPDLNAFAERLGTAGDPSGSAPPATDPGAVDEVGPWRVLRRAPGRRTAAALLGSLALLLLGGVVRRRLSAA